MTIQFRPKDGRSSKFYAPSRDILGFYRPLHESVLEILAERHPDQLAHIEQLRGMTNILINEATGGQQKMTMPELVKAHEEAMAQCAGPLLHEYTALMTSAFTWRYIMGKRETAEEQVGDEDLEKGFAGIYVLSVLPPDIADAVQRHLRAYRHLPDILFNNTPPCRVVEVDDEDA